MNDASSRLPLILLIVGLAVLGVVTGVLAWQLYELRQAPPPGQRSGTLVELPEPRVIADFRLQDQAGRPFELDDLRGRWSVLFFGYTSCPDICPNTLYQMHQAREALAERFAADRLPVFYLVSVDPERDSPDRLAAYVEHFDPAFHGLTGADAQLRALALQLGVVYHIAPHDPGDTQYAVDHSASLLVLDPQARLYGVMPAPHDGDRIASGLGDLLERAGTG